MSDETTAAVSNETEHETAPTERETARAAKQVYLKAVHKLRDAIAAGELTPAKGMAMRNEWEAGEEIPKEYLVEPIR